MFTSLDAFGWGFVVENQSLFSVILSVPRRPYLHDLGVVAHVVQYVVRDVFGDEKRG